MHVLFFRDHLHGIIPQPNPTTESWKSDLIDIIILDIQCRRWGEAQDTIVHDPLTFLCVLHKCPEEEEEGGATSRWAHIAGRSDGSGRRSVVQYVVDTLFFFSFSPEVDAWPSSPPLRELIKYSGRWIDLCPAPFWGHFFFFCGGWEVRVWLRSSWKSIERKTCFFLPP